MKSVSILGAPLDFGGARRGVDMGPSAIRAANLQSRLTELGFEVADLGNLDVPPQESVSAGDAKAKYLDQIATSCRKLANRVSQVIAADGFPIVLGGDHSIAAGVIPGVARKRTVGLIWMDAHGDLNTPETSPSGNVHGMPLAALLGAEPKTLAGPSRLNPANVALVGLRDLDPGERRHIRDWGLAAFTMRDIDERGMRGVMRDAIDVASKGTQAIHLSFDMDVVDPDGAPGVGTPVKGGISYREAHLAMEMIFDSRLLASMDFVEVNPILDSGNRTANLAVELMLSAMGKKIL